MKGTINEKKMVSYQGAVEKVCARYADRDCFLVGQSFGNRVALHYLTGTYANMGNAKATESKTLAPHKWASKREQPSNLRGAITLGYPFGHETQDRAGPLRMLSSPNAALIISGTMDGYATGSFKDELNTVVQANEQLSIVWVKNGRHNVFEGGKKAERAEKNGEIVGAIRAFCQRRAGGQQGDQQGGQVPSSGGDGGDVSGKKRKAACRAAEEEPAACQAELAGEPDVESFETQKSMEEKEE